LTQRKQIVGRFLIKEIYSQINKYYEFLLPTTAKGLERVNVQKKEISTIESQTSLRISTSLKLRLGYVEQETLTLKQYGLTLNSTVFEPCKWQGEGNHYKSFFAPDTGITFFLIRSNFVAVHAKLNVVTQVFSTYLFNDGQIHINTKKEGHYTIPGVGTITVSLEN